MLIQINEFQLVKFEGILYVTQESIENNEDEIVIVITMTDGRKLYKKVNKDQEDIHKYLNYLMSFNDKNIVRMKDEFYK